MNKNPNWKVKYEKKNRRKRKKIGKIVKGETLVLIEVLKLIIKTMTSGH